MKPSVIVVLLIAGMVYADDFDTAVERMNDTGIKAAEEVLAEEAAQYEVTDRLHEDGGVEYGRLGKPIMYRSENGSVYRLLQSDGQRFATVVVGKEWSPKIIIEDKLDLIVELIPTKDGGWELQALSIDPQFLEIYIITSESVTPASVDRYLEQLALMRGSQAAFESIGESLMESTEETVETE